MKVEDTVEDTVEAKTGMNMFARRYSVVFIDCSITSTANAEVRSEPLSVEVPTVPECVS